MEPAAKRATQVHRDHKAYRDRQGPPERRDRQGRRGLRANREIPEFRDRQEPREWQAPPDRRGLRACVVSRGPRESRGLTDPRAYRVNPECPNSRL